MGLGIFSRYFDSMLHAIPDMIYQADPHVLVKTNLMPTTLKSISPGTFYVKRSPMKFGG